MSALLLRLLLALVLLSRGRTALPLSLLVSPCTSSLSTLSSLRRLLSARSPVSLLATAALVAAPLPVAGALSAISLAVAAGLGAPSLPGPASLASTLTSALALVLALAPVLALALGSALLAALSLRLPSLLPLYLGPVLTAGPAFVLPHLALTLPLVVPLLPGPVLAATALAAELALLPAARLPHQGVVLAQVLQPRLQNHHVPFHIVRHLLKYLVCLRVFRLRRKQQVVALGRLRHGNRTLQISVHRHPCILLLAPPSPTGKGSLTAEVHVC